MHLYLAATQAVPINDDVCWDLLGRRMFSHERTTVLGLDARLTLTLPLF